MLSNCKDCQFFFREGCDVNLSYWQAFKKIDRLLRSDAEAIEAVASYIDSCPSFQESEELKPLSIEITLSVRAWKQLAQDVKNDPELYPLLVRVREMTGFNLPNLDNDVAF